MSRRHLPTVTLAVHAQRIAREFCLSVIDLAVTILFRPFPMEITVGNYMKSILNIKDFYLWFRPSLKAL